MMGFGAAVAAGFRKYVAFSGRARRPEYWWFMAFQVIGGIALFALDGALFGFGDHSPQPLGLVFSLIVFIPSLAVSWRRLHDVGKPGYYTFLPILGAAPFVFLSLAMAFGAPNASRAAAILALVVGVGAAIYLFLLMISPSARGENRFGPEPGAEIDPALFD